MLNETVTGFAYLAAAICFILALRGLSSPETARRGNAFGIVGMVIAVATTLASPNVLSYELILAGIVIGGGVGTPWSRSRSR
jgi:NAD(P) transhydrogenase subunit beta